MSIKSEINNLLGNSTPILTRLIVINILVFLAANIYVSLFSHTPLISYIALPANPSVFLVRPWALITYMFLHIGFWHIVFNMLWLYWIGRIFVEYMGEKRLLYTYLIGGVCGGVLFMLIYGVAFPQPTPTFLLGASAGIMAVIVAIAGLLPNYELYLFLIGPVKLKYIAIAAFLLSSVIDFKTNSGGKISHIGGAVYGLIYIWQYRKGNDFVEKTSRLVSRISTLFKHQTAKKAKPINTYNGYSNSTSDKQKHIDAILDKISHSGYESLTKDEKDLLFKSSKDS